MTTGWIFDIILCEDSINQSIYQKYNVRQPNISTSSSEMLIVAILRAFLLRKTIDTDTLMRLQGEILWFSVMLNMDRSRTFSLSIEMRRLTRDGNLMSRMNGKKTLPNPSSETKFSGANADKKIFIFPVVQLTTCRIIGNLTLLIYTLDICVTIHNTLSSWKKSTPVRPPPMLRPKSQARKQSFSLS